MKSVCVFLLLCASVVQFELTAATNAYHGPYSLPHHFRSPGVEKRDDGTTCEPNSEDYEQKTDALRCQEDYVQAVEEEIQRSNCKNTQYVMNDYEDGNVTCDAPYDDRKDVPNCSETCSLRQFYYLYCTYLGEENAAIGRECGSPWDGAGFCSYYNGDFCLSRYFHTTSVVSTCSRSSSGDALECSDECRSAVEFYKESLGCCVSYWRGDIGGNGPTISEIFSACGMEIPAACTSFSPPSEFLDCAHDSQSTDSNGGTAGSAETTMLAGWASIVAVNVALAVTLLDSN